MSVKITDFTKEIKSSTTQHASVFLRLMTDHIVDLSTPKTPKKEGRLREGVIKQVLGLKGTIEWRKSYAAYQERGRRADGTRVVKKYTTAGTKAHFAEDAVKKGIENATTIMRASRLI